MEGKVGHDTLSESWEIAYQALALEMGVAPNKKELLHIIASVLQSIAHTLVDVRESLDTFNRQSQEFHKEINEICSKSD